jgi:hypothetical protein
MKTVFKSEKGINLVDFSTNHLRKGTRQLEKATNELRKETRQQGI